MKSAIPRLWLRRLVSLLLLITLTAAVLLTLGAHAQTAKKTVRVGWYESPFNLTDRLGRRSGYAYEYQRKITAYTGWTYEYVDGSWPELLEMLKRGEIDLMSDVSYTAERTETMLFSALPMGTEAYYVFIAPSNTEITPDDYTSLNGKRVGVNHGSVQKQCFIDWAEQHGVEVELVEMTGSEQDSQQQLSDGKIDAYVIPDAYMSREAAVPIFKVGGSDFFFAVNKDRPDLQGELDAAMNRIKDENKLYNQYLSEKYLSDSGINYFLDARENDWLSRHGTIRVGYQDHYLAFCAKDDTTGELTGALKDYLAYAASGIKNAKLNFEAIAYPTATATLEALQKGEVDCIFPANLADSDGESLGIVMTPSLMQTEMDAVVRSSEQQSFIQKTDITVAVNEGNFNYELFLVDHFPDWKVVHFKDTPTCLDAVAAGAADCIIISNYRFNNVSRQCEKLRLTTIYTGVKMDYSFGVREGDTSLYSILARVTGIVPDYVTNAALNYYSSEDVKTTFTDYIREHFGVLMTIVAGVTLVIVMLLLHSIRAERKIIEEHQRVKDLNEQVFVDALTSVGNKCAFENSIHELQARVDLGARPEFAIGMFDCNNLKLINDHYGHDKGDIYLKGASRLIAEVFRESPVFRIGADEFAVILQGEDYKDMEALAELFDTRRRETWSPTAEKWDEVHVAMGIATYDPKRDHKVRDTVRRADKIMYEKKREEKAQGF